ncbi:hypothetical protein PYCCODRAFT_1353342, partial [Trametes coccinea BRFM310]
VAVIPLSKGLYRLRMPRVEVAAAVANPILRSVTRAELHHELGHISPETAREMVSKGRVEGLVLSDADCPVVDCEACAAGKMMRKLIATEHARPRASVVGGEVHADIWGPSSVETLGKRPYYVLYTDD